MHSRIRIALGLSILLIGVASWSRFSAHSQEAAVLSVVEQQAQEEAYKAFLESFVEASASSTPPEDLTGTDLIGRQLIIDYVSMARSGQATPDALTSLAERYIESIPTLIAAEKVAMIDLKVISNTPANFQAYATGIKRIYSNYSSRLLGIYEEGNISLNPAAFNLSGKIYRETAESLKGMAIPAELAEAHLNLTNLYFENASAMTSVAGSATDPASSFAGILAIKANADKEQEMLGEIEEIVNANGI